MNVAFLTACVYEPVGVPRVQSVLASELYKYHKIFFLTTESPEKKNKSVFSYPSEVQVNYIKYPKRSILRLALMYFNRNFNLYKYISKDSLWNYTYIDKRIQNKIIEYVKKNRIDVLIGVHGEMAYLVGSIKDKVTCKMVGWQHSSFDAYFNTPLKYYYRREFLFKKYISTLDAYIVLNENDAKLYWEYMNIKTTVIHNPVSFKSSDKSKCDKKRFIACGSLFPVKGFEMLIESFSVFSKANDEWVLDIYGDGFCRENLQTLIYKYNLSERVYLRGITKHVAKEMLESSVYLLSSRWEGMPMVVLEALECGLPIVSFDIPAILPLVKHQVNGLIVPKFDIHEYAKAMLKVANDETLRKKMGINSSNHADNFRVETIVDKWNNLFNTI